MYLKFAESVDLACSHHTRKKDRYVRWWLYQWTWIVVTASQRIHISDHHTVYLKRIHFLFVNYTSVKLEESQRLKKIRIWSLTFFWASWGRTVFPFTILRPVNPTRPNSPAIFGQCPKQRPLLKPPSSCLSSLLVPALAFSPGSPDWYGLF